MLRRSHGGALTAAATTLSTSTALTAVRCMGIPGWKQKVSTRDGRSREKRDADRRLRQIEKLPKAQALHDYQYPYDKTVLADAMAQPPVFENEYDTPHLFFHTPSNDFFMYFSVSDFDRTDFPAVPRVDRRLLSCKSSEYNDFRITAHKLLEKHGLYPAIVPHISGCANLSVLWNNDEAEDGAKKTPEKATMTRRNFWHTAHCGNFIPLADVQNSPSVFFTVPQEKQNSLFTLIIASPDYPYRTQHTDGFFLHTVVTNLRGRYISAAEQPKFEDIKKVTDSATPAATVARLLSGKDLESFASSLRTQGGDVVVPYVPPLPTEDAGTTRHMCMLFEQSSQVDKVVAPRNVSEEDEMLPFAERCNFRLHALPHEIRSKRFKSLADVEAALSPDPVAVTFFQTAWDIQVQEFYEAMGLPEPAFVPSEDDLLEAHLQYLAMDPAQARARTRRLADGSVNSDGKVKAQLLPARITDGTATHYLSKRTQLGINKKTVVVPK